MKYLIPIILVLIPTQAFAIDPAVKAACRDDYFQYCAHTVPESESCKKCFKKFAVVLTPSCKNAIKNRYRTEVEEYIKAQK